MLYGKFQKKSVKHLHVGHFSVFRHNAASVRHSTTSVENHVASVRHCALSTRQHGAIVAMGPGSPFSIHKNMFLLLVNSKILVFSSLPT